MKKVILTICAIFALSTATSCGHGGKISTTKDSLAYALGLDVANSLKKNVDSTLNYELICKGIVDAFEGNAAMTTEETQEFLRHYFTEVKPKEDEAKRQALAVENEKLAQTFLADMAKEDGVKASGSGLLYKIEEAGGDKIVIGDTVTLHYTLTNSKGVKLESSKDSGNPMTYTNQEGAMIKGFGEGVALLGKGGKATLYIPAELAYGDNGSGPIGPKEALQFEIEIVDVKKPKK